MWYGHGIVVIADKSRTKKLLEVCRFTAFKDLFAVYCANPPGYNRNFSEFPRFSELAK